MLFKGSKLALSFKDAGKSFVNITVNLADGSTYSGAYDTLNDIRDMFQAGKNTVEMNSDLNGKKSGE